MSELLDLVKKELAAEFENQKQALIDQRDLKNAQAQLQQKYDSLVRQIETMDRLKAPTDFIALYIKNKGRIWVSQKKYLGPWANNVEIHVNNQMLGRPINFPSGVYNLVLMAVPVEDAPEHGTDDYGTMYSLEER